MKKELGQFFTTTNPFNTPAFKKWSELLPDTYFIEPFAGSNNIVKMIKELGFDNEWHCYDIEPSQDNKVPEVNVIQQDTLLNFPEGQVAITNPPYLAKNSATRNHLSYPDTKFDDLYKYSLDIMLKHCDYVAAIIPESFITAGLFMNRLYAFVSLTCKMFDDTDCPVCLALFVPHSKDFMVYRQDEFLGMYSDIENLNPTKSYNWKFNDKSGTIGIKCVDNTVEPSIKFVRGEEIDPNSIKVSSRALTRVSGLPESVDLDKFIDECNRVLNEYRLNTHDLFLTSFKGLRADNMYRRRLDFKNAKKIMDTAMVSFLMR